MALTDPLPALPADYPALKTIWRDTFGDTDEFTDGFFALLPETGFGLVCRAGGRPVSMAWVLEGITVGTVSCAYIYAVATTPEYRGLGCGASLMRACREAALARGSAVICTSPAEPSLYRWYGDVLGMTPAACASEKIFPAGDAGDIVLSPLTAGEYGEVRERLLAGTPHAEFPAGYLAVQELLCAACGGGIFRAGSAAAVCYPEDGELKISELLCPPQDEEACASALAARFGCARARLRVPGAGAPLIAASPSALPAGLLWGLVLD